MPTACSWSPLLQQAAARADRALRARGRRHRPAEIIAYNIRDVPRSGSRRQPPLHARRTPEHRGGQGLHRRLPGRFETDRRGAGRLRGLLGRRLGRVRVRVPGAVGVVSVASHLVGPQINQMLELVGTGRARRQEDPRAAHRCSTRCSSRRTRSCEGGIEHARPPGGGAAVAARARHVRGTGPGSIRTWGTPVSRGERLPRRLPRRVGEVGRNMACVELDGRILIIDVGLSFLSGTCRASTWCCPISTTCGTMPTRSRRSCSLTGTRTTSQCAALPVAGDLRRAGVRHAVHARAAERQTGGAPVTDRCELHGGAGRGRDCRPRCGS